MTMEREQPSGVEECAGMWLHAAFEHGGAETLSGRCHWPLQPDPWSALLCTGRPTGIAMRPLCDLGPRSAHWVLSMPGKGSSDWAYACIPCST